MMMEPELLQEERKKSFDWYKEVIASNGEKLIKERRYGLWKSLMEKGIQRYCNWKGKTPCKS